jgi:predicted nucleic acid-binding protein
MTVLTSIVLDASVVVKWYLGDEAGVADAVRIRDGIAAGVISVVVPSVLSMELAHAVVRATRHGRLQSETAPAILRVHDAFADALEVVAVAEDRAVEIALAAGVGAYDGAYLALARDRGHPLLTADGRLAGVAERVGVLALTLEDAGVVIDTPG